jgi:hypothetical protein
LAENQATLTEKAMTTGYGETYRRSLERPAEFWAEAAEAVD